MPIAQTLPGNTVRISWISSGATADSITQSVFDNQGACVASLRTMLNSGNGHYYDLYTVPTSLGYYVSQIDAVIDSKPYSRRVRFQVLFFEVE